MSPVKKLRVGLAGLGFGAEFVPIYLHHPNVAQLVICDSDPAVLQKIGDRFEVAGRTTDLDALIARDELDAIHLVTPIPLHAEQTLRVLAAGKHCACTVPMATTLAELQAIIDAQQASGKIYMGMETAVYTKRFMYARELQRHGELGRIQFLRGAHYQDMEHWPPYWLGLPPMHYATHAVSPVLALADTQARAVHCFGSGVMRAELHGQYGNPFPVETAIFELAQEPPLAAEVTRSLFHTARGYVESFNVYGEKATFEWEQVEGERPVVFRMRPVVESYGRGYEIRAALVDVPDRQDLLPPEIARFTQRGVYDEQHAHRSFVQGGGHDGSHPHMVQEFVRSIVERRLPWPDAVRTAGWTAAGICAHDSAMQGGARVAIPQYQRASPFTFRD